MAMTLRNLLGLPAQDAAMSNRVAREQWLEQKLRSIPNGSRILDAGAGTLTYSKFCHHLRYVSQDFGQYDGQGDGKGIQSVGFDYGKLDIVCDIINIPEPDASFDAIMCIEVFEHLQDPVLAIKEFARLLKPGGLLVLTAPFCSLTHYAPYHYSTGFNRYWYQHHIEKNGLLVEEIETNGGYFDYLSQEMERVPDVAGRYAASKPTLLDLIGIIIVRRMLQRFRKRDSNSSELLCFGYHVVARRQ